MLFSATFASVVFAVLVGVEGANVVKQRVVYTAPGAAAPIVGNGFGCVNIKANGRNQLGCVKHVFTDGFTVGVTDTSSKNQTLCSIAGNNGICGPQGVNITVDLAGGTGKVPAASGPEGTKDLTAAQLKNLPIAKRANVVKQRVVYSATGAADVVGNGFGCAHIKASGTTQLGCVKHVFTDGFTVGITDEKTKKVTLCSIPGNKGTCSAAGVGIQVDLTGGTGKVPAASGPLGTTTLTAPQLSNLPLKSKRFHSRDFAKEGRELPSE